MGFGELVLVCIAAGMGILAYLSVAHGVPWVIAKVKSWWTSTETRFQAIEAEIKALKSKVGL